MTIFLTGGSGKTSRRIATELAAIAPQTPVLTSSRSAPAAPAGGESVRFDWLDESTYKNPFDHALARQSPISAIYIVLPVVDDPLPAVRAFVDVALSRSAASLGSGTGPPLSSSEPVTLTLVLLSTAVLEPSGDPTAVGHARVHQYLLELTSASNSAGQAQTKRSVSYAVLRPAFFMENFSEQQHRTTIAGPEGTIYSATGEGGEAFVSAEDIAAVGARCLIGTCELDRDYIITGPERLSYSDVARLVGEVIERQITHTPLTTRQLVDRYAGAGMPRQYAAMLADLDERIRDGLGEKPVDTIEKVTGRKAVSFQQFCSNARPAWT